MATESPTPTEAPAEEARDGRRGRVPSIPALASARRFTQTNRFGKYLLPALAIALVASYPWWPTQPIDMDTVFVMAVYVMLALGLNIVVGYAGLLDLGYVAFFAIGAYTAAFLASPHFDIHVSWWIVVWVAVLAAAISGILLGAPTLRLRGDYLAIVTLAFGEIVPRAFLNLDWLTNGAKGMNPIGRPHGGGTELLASDQVPWYYLILAVTAFSVFVMVRLRDSRLGRAWVAMREDEIAAASMGINLVKTKLLAFALGASFSGFGGALYASMLQFIDPFQFDFSISIILLAMVILGGIGNIWGVMFGALVMGWFNFIFVDAAAHWLRGLSTALNQPWLAQIDVANSKLMVFGLALVLMMLIRPEGIFPSAQRKAELTHARRGTLAAGSEPVITE